MHRDVGSLETISSCRIGLVRYCSSPKDLIVATVLETWHAKLTTLSKCLSLIGRTFLIWSIAFLIMASGLPNLRFRVFIISGMLSRCTMRDCTASNASPFKHFRNRLMFSTSLMFHWSEVCSSSALNRGHFVTSPEKNGRSGSFRYDD